MGTINPLANALLLRLARIAELVDQVSRRATPPGRLDRANPKPLLTRVSTGQRERWLLVKTRDRAADARRNPVGTRPESVLSGRTVEQVAEEAG
jgi:hypothetical protein